MRRVACVLVGLGIATIAYRRLRTKRSILVPKAVAGKEQVNSFCSEHRKPYMMSFKDSKKIYFSQAAITSF